MINHKKSFFQQLSGLSATVWIITINIIIFLVVLFALHPNQNNVYYFALNPSSILQGKYLWTLLLHIFTHISPEHLFVNMFALLSLGKLSERIIGKKRFIGFYIISGLFAGILSVLLSGFFGYGIGEKIFGPPISLMVGASGAIFAVAGLFVVLLPKLKFSIIFLPFWSFSAYKIIPIILFAMWALSISLGLPIWNTAHFGGFIAGITYGFYLKTKYKNKVMMLQSYFRN